MHVLIFLPRGERVGDEMRRMSSGSRRRVALVGLAVGALFQVVKVSFPGRHPSLFHAPFNMLGSLAGAFFAARVHTTP